MHCAVLCKGCLPAAGESLILIIEMVRYSKGVHIHCTLHHEYYLALRKELLAKVYVAVSLLFYRPSFVSIRGYHL